MPCTVPRILMSAKKLLRTGKHRTRKRLRVTSRRRKRVIEFPERQQAHYDDHVSFRFAQSCLGLLIIIILISLKNIK